MGLLSSYHMILFPNAKINLGLYVTEKRSDGYHNIESVFYPLPWKDILEINESATALKFSSSGLPIPGDSSGNLCVKAYHLLAQQIELPRIHIHLHKIIPMGAGLGGGSADAAFVLKYMVSQYASDWNNEQVAELAAQLGADCAFFVHNKPMLATGKGEILSPISIDLSGWNIVVVHPGIHVSTPLAYSWVKPSSMKFDLVRQLTTTAPEQWRDSVGNDFEHGVFSHHPEIASIKTQLYKMGAAYASMSGSGSAVFGLFRSKPPGYTWASNYTVFGQELR